MNLFGEKQSYYNFKLVEFAITARSKGEKGLGGNGGDGREGRRMKEKKVGRSEKWKGGKEE